MKHIKSFVLTTLGVAFLTSPLNAAIFTLINSNTPGFYNSSIGNLLDDTSPAFPTFESPDLDFTNAPPNLSAAQSVLGNWLSAVPNLSNGFWSSEAALVPQKWLITTESAIVYPFEIPTTGFTNLVMKFGVDNGIFVWLDGSYLGGFIRFGPADLGEHQFTVTNISAGTHYLQVLREDHGGGVGYDVEVTISGAAVPVEAQIHTAVEVSWMSQQGALYQSQFVTELGSTNWNALGQPRIGTGAKMTAFDSIQGTAQRFYRIVVLQ